jgi:hypothetical protein
MLSADFNAARRRLDPIGLIPLRNRALSPLGEETVKGLYFAAGEAEVSIVAASLRRWQVVEKPRMDWEQ